MASLSLNFILQKLFDSLAIHYDTIQTPDCITLDDDWQQKSVAEGQLTRIALLRDDNVAVMALMPASHQLNLSKLNTLLHRKLRFLHIKELKKFLQHFDNRPGQLNTSMGVQLIIDEAVTNQDVVYFEAHQSQSLLRVHSNDLIQLSSDVLIGSSFSDLKNPQPTLDAENSTRALHINERVKNLTSLPVLPGLTTQILQLRNNRHATVEQLADIITQEPAMAAQIIRYANSAMFGHRGNVKTLSDAIFRVLGFEAVMHLALGMSMSKAFKLPKQGPLGQQQLWQNATYSAALCQKLASCTDWEHRLQPGLAYLVGLLHNIGFLALGQLFEHEYSWLNKVVESEPDSPITLIENRLLGSDHTELGNILMSGWHMPEELTITVKQHHNLDYTGEHENYVWLAQLSDQLLKTHGMSDADHDEITPALYKKLGIPEEQIYISLDEVFQGKETLDEMTLALSA